METSSLEAAIGLAIFTLFVLALVITLISAWKAFEKAG